MITFLDNIGLQKRTISETDKEEKYKEVLWADYSAADVFRLWTCHRNPYKGNLYFPYAFVFLFGRYVLSSQTRIYSIKSKTVAYSLWGIFSDIRCILL